jgi:hypothetical protein
MPMRASTVEERGMVAAMTLLVCVLLVWGTTLVIVWRTYVGMNPASGAIAALADAASHGRAPGSGGDPHLATLYLPPFPLLVAALHAVGLDWLGALRSASLGTALMLLGAVAMAVRAAAGGRLAMAVAVSLLVVSFPFQAASLAGRADTLAAALTLAALAMWLRDPALRGWGLPLAGALAWLTKATACAVPVAVVMVSLIGTERRALRGFALRFLAALAAGLALLLPWHGPQWIVDALRTMLFAPPHTSIPLRGPAEVLRYLASYAELAVIAAFALAMFALPDARLRPLRWAMAVALLIALAVMANRQSDHNHLLEVLALGAVGAGIVVERLWRGAESDALLRSVLIAALLGIVLTAASWRNVDSYHRAAAQSASRRTEILAAVRRAPEGVLTEDPLLSLAAGRTAAVADPAVLRSLALAHDPRATRIIGDFRRGRWAMLVFEMDPVEHRDGWYRDFHFGSEAMTAILERYELVGEVEGYSLYSVRK